MTKLNLRNLREIYVVLGMATILLTYMVLTITDGSAKNKRILILESEIKQLNSSEGDINTELVRLLAENTDLKRELWRRTEGPTLVGEDWVEHDNETFGSTPRSPKWPTVRARFICDGHDKCFVCCTTDDLNVHHIKPFHKYPELELDPDNLITLCRKHHFTIGHDPDYTGPEKPSWSKSNPNVTRDAIRAAKKLNPEWQECK